MCTMQCSIGITSPTYSERFMTLGALLWLTFGRCHPPYLTAKAHSKLSKPQAFDGLRIHTDEINEVIARLAPRTLTVAVVIPQRFGARLQTNLNADNGLDGLVRRSVKRSGSASSSSQLCSEDGGTCTASFSRPETMVHSGLRKSRVHRQTGCRPFTGDVYRQVRRRSKVQREAKHTRVNMYASTWVLTKTVELPINQPPASLSIPMSTETTPATLEELEI